MEKKIAVIGSMSESVRQILSYVLNISEINHWIDATSFSSLKQVTDTIGTKEVTLLITKPFDLGNSLIEVPPNITLQFLGGGSLQLRQGETVIINGAIDAGLQQIFFGRGRVIGKVKSTPFYPQWWGAVGDGTTDDGPAIQAAIDSLPEEGGVIIIPPGEYVLSGDGGKSAPDLAKEAGDSNVAFQSKAGVHISGAKFVTVKAQGAKFLCKKSGFVFYRCFNCSFKGGSFFYENTNYNEEPYALSMIRSISCRLDGVFATKFHRNLVSYRNTGGGIYNCHATLCNYFNFYSSSNNDVILKQVENTLTPANSRTRSEIRNCVAAMGKTANYFADWTICEGNKSYTISEDETTRPTFSFCHFMTQYGQVDFLNNYIFESANLNTRNYAHGFNVSTTGSNPEISNVVIKGNTIIGCMKGVMISGCHDFMILDNIIQDYWLTGIQANSNSSTNGNLSLNRGIISKNIVGNINSKSEKLNQSKDKRAAIQCQKNTANLESIIITHNICSMDRSNDYNLYVENLSGGIISDNIFNGNGLVKI